MKIDLKWSDLSAEDLRFAIIVSRWNHSLTSKLAEGAVNALKEANCPEGSIETFPVPGAFELPLACLKAAETGDYDAVIALGAVIRGETPHFDYVAGQAAAGITQASLQSGVPILFGVITADNEEQAVARASDDKNNKGYEAAVSAVEMAYTIRDISERTERYFQEKVLPDVF